MISSNLGSDLGLKNGLRGFTDFSSVEHFKNLYQRKKAQRLVLLALRQMGSALPGTKRAWPRAEQIARRPKDLEVEAQSETQERPHQLMQALDL